MSSPTQPAEKPTDSPSTDPARMSIRWWLSRILPGLSVVIGGLLVIVLLGVAQRVGWLGAETSGTPSTAQAEQVFTCPMHPQIRQPGAGRCPICGMELVPATASADSSLDQLSVKIEPAQRRLANIQTASVSRQPLAATIETIGSIAIDESRMATVSSYIDGRLERLFADYTGVDVARGDHLAVIYSPELYSAQVEYLEARKAVQQVSSSLAAVRQAQEKLVVNGRQRLVELGMTETQIGELEQSGVARSRLTIFTPIGGTVIEKLAVEGKYVVAGEPIYRVADLSTVWLMLELYPEDAARIRYGQRVEAEMQSLPGQVISGRVAFVDPQVDTRKRTVGVRVEFLNGDRSLRPGDYANATIYLPVGQSGEVYDTELAGRWISPMHPQIISDSPGKCSICGMDLVPTTEYGYSDVPVEQPASLFVPRSALLMAGNRSVVYVEEEPGRFEIRPVVLGPILRDKVIILGGVAEGERVATAGNFLIDSQMQLAGKPSLIDPTRAIQAQEERNTPLSIPQIEQISVSGQTGALLEELYDTYFSVQRSLAADQLPSADMAQKLFELASELETLADVSTATRDRLATIAESSQHLHHMTLDEARHDAFRPISHAIVELAASVRGAEAERPFFQMFCPMVRGGAGDWLQADNDRRNPYWGSQMLKCGETVREWNPVTSRVHSKQDDHSSQTPALQHHEHQP